MYYITVQWLEWISAALDHAFVVPLSCSHDCDTFGYLQVTFHINIQVGTVHYAQGFLDLWQHKYYDQHHEFHIGLIIRGKIQPHLQSRDDVWVKSFKTLKLTIFATASWSHLRPYWSQCWALLQHTLCLHYDEMRGHKASNESIHHKHCTSDINNPCLERQAAKDDGESLDEYY